MLSTVAVYVNFATRIRPTVSAPPA